MNREDIVKTIGKWREFVEKGANMCPAVFNRNWECYDCHAITQIGHNGEGDCPCITLGRTEVGRRIEQFLQEG